MTMTYAILRRRVIESMRYPFELLFGLVAFYGIFVLLFLGARSFGGASVRTGDALSAIAVGYVVFMLMQQAYQTLGNQLTMESQSGTLEQLAMNPHGLMPVLLIDFLVQCLLLTLQIGIVIIPIMATTGRWLHFDAISVALLLALTMSGVVGIGLVMGGLAIVLKRIAGPSQILGFAFLFLVAAPVNRLKWLKFLPIGHGNELLRQVLVHGKSIFDMPGDVLLLIVVSAAYLLLGAGVFRVMERKARERALLGQY